MKKIKNSYKKAGRPKKTRTLSDVKKIYGSVPVTEYDYSETTDFINPGNPITLKSLGFTLPPDPPTQVISIRLPRNLLNQIRAMSSERDIPYQALIKIFLSDSIRREKKKGA